MGHGEPQIVQHILAVEEHLEGHLLGDAPHPILIGGGAHEAGPVLGGSFCKSFQLTQIHYRAAHGKVLGRGLT